MNTKPIIGIAPNYSYEKKEYTLSEDYVLAIEKAGGCPIVLLPRPGRCSRRQKGTKSSCSRTERCRVHIRCAILRPS